MAIYEYKCSQGHMYEEERPMTEKQKVIDCPTCGERLSRIFTSNGVIFKAKGFYSTGG